MKTLLFKTLACAAVLLPLGQIQAKTFGSFTPNKMFTLELTAKESFKVKPGGARKNSGIPNGVPNFKIGQKVKFKIGSKGQLIGPGFSISFRDSATIGGLANIYQDPKKPGSSTRKLSLGQIYVVDNLPTSGNLTFTVFNINGLNSSVSTVVYVFGE